MGSSRRCVAAGGGSSIGRTTEYITTTENYRGTADVSVRSFGRPTRGNGVIVKGLLREGALIEISAIAILRPRAATGRGRRRAPWANSYAPTPPRSPSPAGAIQGCSTSPIRLAREP
jgi:hypothetical protein